MLSAALQDLKVVLKHCVDGMGWGRQLAALPDLFCPRARHLAYHVIMDYLSWYRYIFTPCKSKPERREVGIQRREQKMGSRERDLTFDLGVFLVRLNNK